MADSTVDITRPFDRPQKLLKIIDNLDGTYSVSINGTVTGTFTLPTGAATSANQTTEITQLQSINPLSSEIWTSLLISYTDATKTVISKVEWFKGAVLVKTYTPTFGATSDTWVKS
jgi:hypothetical protein